jgi:hypothetical protein
MTSTSFQLLWLWPCGGAGAAESLSPNNGISSQVDESNHEDEDKKVQKDKKQQSDDTSTRKRLPQKHLQQAQLQQRHDDNMPLEEMSRITKQDSKSERRHKYKQCFVRNNVVMVRLGKK